MATESNWLSARQVAEVTFSTSLRGYDLDQVDALLQKVAATLTGRAGNDPAITAGEVAHPGELPRGLVTE